MCILVCDHKYVGIVMLVVIIVIMCIPACYNVVKEKWTLVTPVFLSASICYAGEGEILKLYKCIVVL